MKDEVNDHTAAGSLEDGEKRYPDSHDLYSIFFGALGSTPDGTKGGTVGSAELGELWRRWLEATAAGIRNGTAGTESGFAGSMAPLWAGMAAELRDEMLSGESLPEDPVRFFLRWYEANAERWSEAADELLKKEEVLESMGRFLEVYASSHKQRRRASEENLKNLRIPTPSDVARVAKLVVLVENKVDRMEEAFGEFIYGDSEPATASAVAGLEERMNRLEGKMDRILAALEKREEC